MDMGYWYATGRFDRRLLMSEDFVKTQYHDRLGNYRPLTANHHGTRNHPKGRMMWDDTGMHDLVRMVTNWISGAGFITRTGWTFKAFSPEMSDEKYVSDERFWRAGGELLDKVPYIRGRGCDRHGGEGDTIIGRGVVYDKYVEQETSQHIIALAAWAEDLEGQILQVCPINACLPSRKQLK